MPLLETSAGTVAYDEAGTGNPVVLLHAGGHDRRDYEEVRALLPQGLRSIALDWPSHGESPASAGPHTVTSFADAAEEFVEARTPQGAVVVGNSVGGFAAARLALRRPQLVKGLVIVAGGGFAGSPPHERVFCALMSRPGFLRRVYPWFSARYMRSRTEADRRARQTAIATTRDEAGAVALSGLWGSFASPAHDLRAEAGAIAAPTLLIWGRRDPVIPVSVGRSAVESIPGARLAEFDAGHIPQTSCPDGFAAELVPFAQEVFS